MSKKDNDPLFYIKGLPADRIAAMAKAAGYDPDADVDEDDGEGSDEDEGGEDLERSHRGTEVVDEAALLKSIAAVEAQAAREMPAVDPGALFADAADEAARVDASGLLKSLVQSQREASDGMAAVLDEVSTRLGTQQVLAQANGHATLRLAKSLAAVVETQAETNDLLAQLLAAIGQPDTRRSIHAAQPMNKGGRAPAPQPARPVARFPSELPQQPQGGEQQPQITRGRARAALLKSVERARKDGDLGRIHTLTSHISLIESGGALTDEIRNEILAAG